MSDSREVWFVRRRFTGRTYPVTWQGWVVTLAFAAFVIAMMILGAVIAVTAFVVAGIAAVFLVAFAYLRLVFRHSSGSRDVSDYRDRSDA